MSFWFAFTANLESELYKFCFCDSNLNVCIHAKSSLSLTYTFVSSALQIWFAFVNGFSGQILFERWCIGLYNVVSVCAWFTVRENVFKRLPCRAGARNSLAVAAQAAPLLQPCVIDILKISLLFMSPCQVHIPPVPRTMSWMCCNNSRSCPWKSCLEVVSSELWRSRVKSDTHVIYSIHTLGRFVHYSKREIN